jgi:predicted dehydrogenase
MNLLLVGAGQLGSRHLQACLKHKNKLDIYVVDSSEVSLSIAEERAKQVEMGSPHSIIYFQNLDSVKEKNFDYMIVATSASVRYSVLAASLNRFNVRYAIFEKVLFQDLESFSNAADMLKRNNVISFVNCPLRVYPFYKFVKNRYINKDKPTRFKYSAGEWCGLACNAIHFIDIMNYITDSDLDDVNVESLDDSFIQSKRVGYIEFTGLLNISFTNGSQLSLNSIKGSGISSVIEILNGDCRIIVDELTGKYKIYENELLVEDSQYELLYQSDLTNKIIEQIESTGTCDLISYEDSRVLHEKFLKALLGHYNKINGDADNLLSLPIT